jgi:hypothetical protein
VRAVRDHLRWLKSEGVGLHQVASVTGVKRETLRRILRIGRRPSDWCRRSTADRVLAVGLHDIAGAAEVDAAATWDLLGCLLRAGWPKARVARALGSRAANPALQVRRDRVLGRTARAVRELHDRAWIADAAVRLGCPHETVRDPDLARAAALRRESRKVASAT